MYKTSCKNCICYNFYKNYCENDWVQDSFVDQDYCCEFHKRHPKSHSENEIRELTRQINEE